MVFVLLLALACLMALLPLLETNQYQNRLTKGSFPMSLITHFWYTIISTIILPVLMLLILINGNPSYIEPLFAIVFTILWIVGSVLYLYLFKSELSSRKI